MGISLERSTLRRFVFLPAARVACAISLLALVLGSPSSLGAEAKNVDWPIYLGGKGRSLYSPLKQINRENVSQLEVAWTYETGDQSEYQANNLIVDGVLYTPTATRKIIALNAVTGKEIWIWDPAKERSGQGRARQRGLLYWQNEVRRGETTAHRRGWTSLCGGRKDRRDDSIFWGERINQSWVRVEHAGRRLQGARDLGRGGRSGGKFAPSMSGPGRCGGLSI